MVKRKTAASEITLSERARQMPYSPIRKLAGYADDARKRGIKVHHLNIGQPDIDTPPEIFQAIAGHRETVLGYGPSGGIADLRLAIAEYHRDLGFDLDVRDVWITCGGSEAIIFAMMTVCDPGDEIIVFEPFYTNYNGFARMANVKLVPVTLSIKSGFHVPGAAEIEKRLSARTRAILVNTPNNPTGTVLTEEEMFILQRLCRKHNLYLISDEVYREFVYDGARHVSALSLSEIADRVIVIDSISKRFSACGARVGSFVSRNREVMDAVLRFCQARLCPPTLEQVGAVAAYRNIKRYIAPMIREYEHRRNVLHECLGNLKGVYGHKPEGAFYMIVSLPIKDADAFCQWLLTDFQRQQETVMLAPANGFYSSPTKGKNEVRIAYVLKETDLRRAVDLLGQALADYPQR